MRALSDNEMYIIGLFGLENEDIQSIEYIRDGNNAIVDVFLMPHPLRCPDCGYDQPKIKNYVLKNIIDHLTHYPHEYLFAVHLYAQ